MLKIENLNKSYKNNHIFNNFNLEIPKGKMVLRRSFNAVVLLKGGAKDPSK